MAREELQEVELTQYFTAEEIAALQQVAEIPYDSERFDCRGFAQRAFDVIRERFRNSWMVNISGVDEQDQYTGSGHKLVEFTDEDGNEIWLEPQQARAWGKEFAWMNVYIPFMRSEYPSDHSLRRSYNKGNKRS